METRGCPFPTNAAVLIGGKSSRMGAPKTLLKAGDRFVLESLVAAAAEVANEVILVGQAPIPGSLAARTRLDDIPGIEGPLAGLLAAFRWQPQSAWIALSCDLPLMSAAALRWLLAQTHPGLVAVMPHLESPEIVEPLASLYAPDAGPLLEQAARAGQRSIRHILAGKDILSPQPPEQLRSAFRNVNTPEQWQAVLMERQNNAGSEMQGVV